jgi:2-dehydro-3-deoxyphosphooctonate aldolase (KDO 8-P synthase)
LIKLDDHFIGRQYPFFLIAGPCVIEDRDQSIAVARHLKTLGEELGILVVFKSSFDKANRTAGSSFRGPGMKAGLKILADIKDDVGLPVLTDIHLPAQADPVGEVVDVIQIPAFLCRQTDLLEAAGKTNKVINIKKGQFASPREMVAAADKVRSAGGNSVMLCERGTTFGYHNLVVDMRSLDVMAQSNCPVVFDATHSVQLPASQGYQSGGQREYVPVLARAAVAVGIAGLFMEVHPNPERALSDGPNAWPLELLDDLIRNLQELDTLVKARFPSEINA